MSAYPPAHLPAYPPARLPPQAVLVGLLFLCSTATGRKLFEDEAALVTQQPSYSSLTKRPRLLMHATVLGLPLTASQIPTHPQVLLHEAVFGLAFANDIEVQLLALQSLFKLGHLPAVANFLCDPTPLQALWPLRLPRLRRPSCLPRLPRPSRLPRAILAARRGRDSSRCFTRRGCRLRPSSSRCTADCSRAASSCSPFSSPPMPPRLTSTLSRSCPRCSNGSKPLRPLGMSAVLALLACVPLPTGAPALFACTGHSGPIHWPILSLWRRRSDPNDPVRLMAGPVRERLEQHRSMASKDGRGGRDCVVS